MPLYCASATTRGRWSTKYGRRSTRASRYTRAARGSYTRSSMFRCPLISWRNARLSRRPSGHEIWNANGRSGLSAASATATDRPRLGIGLTNSTTSRLVATSHRPRSISDGTQDEGTPSARTPRWSTSLLVTVRSGRSSAIGMCSSVAASLTYSTAGIPARWSHARMDLHALRCTLLTTTTPGRNERWTAGSTRSGAALVQRSTPWLCVEEPGSVTATRRAARQARAGSAASVPTSPVRAGTTSPVRGLVRRCARMPTSCPRAASAFASSCVLAADPPVVVPETKSMRTGQDPIGRPVARQTALEASAVSTKRRLRQVERGRGRRRDWTRVDGRIAAVDDIIDSKRAAGRRKDEHARPYLESLREEVARKRAEGGSYLRVRKTSHKFRQCDVARPGARS